MSGGVDSSVAAALLKKQGYFVMGGFMKNFSQESWRGVLDNDCPWEENWKDVRAVCQTIGIECRSFNFEKEYREKVIEYFFKEYALGRTPNPDIICNKEIKFKIFLEKASELGFDFIATGHYVRIVRKIKNYELLKGLDPKKDQSYFLYTLTQEQLARVLFPIGKYLKSEVRFLAGKFGLPNAEKKDSQGICFVGNINLKEFLKQRIPEKTGIIVDTSGREIGRHKGIWYYTIGQRKGIGIGGIGPLYVVKKDTQKNVLVVTRGSGNNQLYQKELCMKDIHWIGHIPSLPIACCAKIRYRSSDQKCRVEKINNRYIISFYKPQYAPAAGQAVVFYKRDQVLGGGIIETILTI